MKKLEKDIVDLKAHNLVLQKMLQYFNKFEKELQTLRELLHITNSKIVTKNERTQKEENKLGLSWAKLSCQLGFGRTVL